MLAYAIGPGIRLGIEALAHVPALQADRQQLETVLINLAINARDAMTADGGQVFFGAAPDVVAEAAERHVAGLAPGKYVRLWVTDTGAGMDAATLARATEPFFTTKPKDRGTGLGLSMAHGFAAQSGGALHLESERGRSTTATLWFPEAHRELDMVVASDQRSMSHAVVVDDVPFNMALFPIPPAERMGAGRGQ